METQAIKIIWFWIWFWNTALDLRQNFICWHMLKYAVFNSTKSIFPFVCCTWPPYTMPCLVSHQHSRALEMSRFTTYKPEHKWQDNETFWSQDRNGGVLKLFVTPSWKQVWWLWGNQDSILCNAIPFFITMTTVAFRHHTVSFLFIVNSLHVFLFFLILPTL
jgi:hypothetical protein